MQLFIHLFDIYHNINKFEEYVIDGDSIGAATGNMVGDVEHGEQEHASGLQRAHERPAGDAQQQEEQQEKREVQGPRGGGLRGDNAGRARRHRVRPEHQGRGPRDGAARQPPREASLLPVGAAPAGVAGAQTHDLVQEVR